MTNYTPSDPVSLVRHRLEERDCLIIRDRGDRFMAQCCGHDDHTPSLSVATADDGKALLTCFAGCDLDQILGALALEKSDLFAENEKSWSLKISSPLDAKPNPEGGHSSVTSAFDLDSDKDSDRDRGQNTGEPGEKTEEEISAEDYSTLAEDGLPEGPLGDLLRQYRRGELDEEIRGAYFVTVPLKMPRGSTLRSLAEWIKLCLELRINCMGCTVPMGFSRSMGATLMGWDHRNQNHRQRVGKLLHQLEELGIIEFAGTVKVPRRGANGIPMRCFLPVGVQLAELLKPEAEVIQIGERRAA